MFQAVRNKCDRWNILWAIVFGSRIESFWASRQLSLCIHTPTAHSTTISRFLCNFLPFFDEHDSPSNLADPDTLVLLRPTLQGSKFILLLAIFFVWGFLVLKRVCGFFWTTRNERVVVEVFPLSLFFWRKKRGIPRTRFVAARQVSNAHERDLVKNKNV